LHFDMNQEQLALEMLLTTNIVFKNNASSR